jgi:hypothetical protein
MIVDLKEVDGLEDSVETLRSRVQAAAAAEKLFQRRLKYTDEKNGWKYAVFRMDDGSPSYCKIILAALSDGEAEVPVEDVYGKVFTLENDSFSTVKTEALYVCIHIAFLSGARVCFMKKILCVYLYLLFYCTA